MVEVAVQFGLLGDVEVRVDGRRVDVGHARQRCVLVVLLVEANQPVTVDQLVDRVWGQRVPLRARDTLYSYLSRLRQALAPADEVALTRQPGGYVLAVDPMAVDLHRFHSLVAQARGAEEDRALVFFEEALGLWRGDAFAALDTSWLNVLRAALDRERHAVELDCTDLRLGRGQHGWLLGELFTRAAAHPLDERLTGQLMLALYQAGRQADSLEHFHQLRRRLVEELGIEPGPALQRLYEQILATHPALTAPIADRSRPPSARPVVPRQLPAHTPYFVGRAEELRQLTALLDTPTAEGGTVVISAIDGTAGIGKTTLAVHWAHQVGRRFPDGQLYVNLRGFDPAGPPMQPTEAVRGFLEALDVPADRIPAGLDARAGLYRSLLADRHVLIVLDNARDTDQVRPLLPGSPSCLVVITSRNQLAGLVAQQGARSLSLDVLTRHEATALLARRFGPDRVAAEADAVLELINYCARLPLALAILAARATTHPSLPLRALAHELADEHTRLDALDTGDSSTSVRAVLSWSYQHLPTRAARLFRLLGLHPGPDISLPAAAGVAALSLDPAREALGELTRAHLLTEHAPGRFTFHDLLRTYAKHLAGGQDSEEEQRAALTRLFDHYLHSAAVAMDTLYPAEQHRRPRVPPPDPHTPPVADPTTARAWLDAERATLTAACAYTAAHGWPGHTTALATTLYRYLDTGSHLPDALTVHTHALHTARHTGDLAEQAFALGHLGVVYWRQDHDKQAAEHLQQGLALSQEIGDRVGEVRALGNLGVVYLWQGRYEPAAEHLRQALALSREIGDRAGEVNALAHLGDVCQRQGHYGSAAGHLRQALMLSREIGDRTSEVNALAHLGDVCQRQGHYGSAADHLQQALTLSQEIGDRAGEADALVGLGDVYQRQGRYELAADHLDRALALSSEIGCRVGQADALVGLGDACQRQGRYEPANDHHEHALALFREIGDRPGETRARNGIGAARHAIGDPDQARTQHTAALTLATQIGDRYEQARAHHGLAHTHHATGDIDQARYHWRHSLALYTALGVPDADDAPAQLAVPAQATAEDTEA